MRFLTTALVVALVAAALPARAATFVVTNTKSGGAGSLAQAITDANLTVDPDEIHFNITSPSLVKTIGGTLPAITQPLTIDGYTQPGALANTLPSGATNAVIRIELDGSALAVGGIVLAVTDGNTTVRGIAIKNIPLKGAGIDVSGDGDVSVRGCFIGTNAAGTVGSSSGNGIVVRSSASIGTPADGNRNLISGHLGVGVLVRGFGVSMLGNLVGTNAAGEPVLGNSTGLLFSSSTGVSSIGGCCPEQGSVFAGNTGAGIRIGQDADGGVSIGANSFFDNGGLAIDLLGDGVTANDEGDADSGPNGLQNFPVLTFARTNEVTITVEGHLESEPGNYRLSFYRSAEADPSGFGEGATFVESVEVTIPDGENFVSFSAELAEGDGLPSESVLTAYAENMGAGAASEFSNAIEILAGGQELVVTNTSNSGVGSLRQAVQIANADPDIDTVVFDLPDAGPQGIALATGIAINNPVIVDGYSQPGSLVNTLETGTNAELRIVLDASGFQGSDSAVLVVNEAASDSVFRGLVIQGAPKRGISIFGADRVHIEGCFIGTDATGMVDEGNAGAGIHTGDGTGIVIGGALAAQRNIVSGNDIFGIVDQGTGTVIVNNIVGGDALGTGNVGNGFDGISLEGLGAQVGGDEAGLGNLVRGNQRAGIGVDEGIGHQILGNSILDNGGLGIDLDLGPPGSPGVTGNDVDDDDGGANASQNFPSSFGAEVEPGLLAVGGILDVPADTNEALYTVRVYANSECDPSGHGEGEFFLGARQLQFSGADEKFSFDLPVDLPDGMLLTATATEDATGNTSEFSECFDPAFEPVFCGDPSRDGQVSSADALLTLRAAVGSGECALCRCDVNNAGGITSTDALLVLRVGVGQELLLDCVQCE